MRLFISIELEEKLKKYLSEKVLILKRNSEYGSFTRADNLHLTLAFIGETANYHKVIEILDSIKIEPIDLKINGAGKFKRNDGNIYWAKCEKNPALLRIQRVIAQRLRASRFDIETRAYTPHITLSRRTRLHKEFDESNFMNNFDEISQKVDCIVLNESIFQSTGVIYRKVYTRKADL